LPRSTVQGRPSAIHEIAEKDDIRMLSAVAGDAVERLFKARVLAVDVGDGIDGIGHDGM
jgi:hypothetical protein